MTEIPFDKTTDHGHWTDDSKDHVIVYHGTHKRNVEAIKKTGLNRPDPKTGMISVTMDPHTAHGYAAMSGSGGEANFRKVGGGAVNTPHEDRAVLKYKIPKKWLHDNMDHDLSGNVGDARKRMASKDEYEKWRKENPHASDHSYYQTSEFRLKKAVPPEFCLGHMHKVKSDLKENYSEWLLNEAVLKLGSAKPKTADNVHNFMKDYHASTSQHPFADRERVHGDFATSEISPDKDGIWLSDIRSLKPGSGAGSRAIEHIRSLADRHGVPIRGVSKAYHSDKRYLKQGKLNDFYKKRGFKISRNGEMEYTPNKKD